MAGKLTQAMDVFNEVVAGPHTSTLAKAVATDRMAVPPCRAEKLPIPTSNTQGNFKLPAPRFD
jgi:hypothetical protein